MTRLLWHGIRHRLRLVRNGSEWAWLPAIGVVTRAVFLVGIMEGAVAESSNAVFRSSSTVKPVETSVISVERGKGEGVMSFFGFLRDDFGVGNEGRSAVDSKEHSTCFYLANQVKLCREISFCLFDVRLSFFYRLKPGGIGFVS